jgi:hypothetical protein
MYDLTYHQERKKETMPEPADLDQLSSRKRRMSSSIVGDADSAAALLLGLAHQVPPVDSVEVASEPGKRNNSDTTPKFIGNKRPLTAPPSLNFIPISDHDEHHQGHNILVGKSPVSVVSGRALLFPALSPINLQLLHHHDYNQNLQDSQPQKRQRTAMNTTTWRGRGPLGPLPAAPMLPHVNAGVVITNDHHKKQ